MKNRGAQLAVDCVRSRKYRMDWYIFRDRVEGSVFLTNNKLHLGGTLICDVSLFLLQRCRGVNNEEAAKLLEQYMDEQEAAEVPEVNEGEQMMMRHFTRAIHETRAKTREWVIRISDGGDLHTVTESRYVRYCDRHKVVCTVAEFLTDGGEAAAEICDEAAAEALREYIIYLNSVLESNAKA